MAKEIVGEEPRAELGAFIVVNKKKKEEIQEVPFVYYPNFIAKVADVVSKHEG